MNLTFINADGLKETVRVNSLMIFDTAAIDADDLSANACQFWRDEVNHKIMVITKYSDGTTVKTGTLCTLS